MAANCFYFETDVMIDLRKAKIKFYNKKTHAKQLGIDFLLTFEEYVLLLEQAGITEQNVGQSINHYHLARYNDSGAYKIDNCRFITQPENMKERKPSKKSRESSRQKLLALRNSPDKQIHDQIRRNGLEKYWDKLRIVAEEKRKLLHPSYIGSKNSQFGTCWITNGVINKKIHKSDLEEWIRNGYHQGRKLS